MRRNRRPNKWFAPRSWVSCRCILILILILCKTKNDNPARGKSPSLLSQASILRRNPNITQVTKVFNVIIFILASFILSFQFWDTFAWLKILFEKHSAFFFSEFEFRCGSRDDACLVSYMRHEDGEGVMMSMMVMLIMMMEIWTVSLVIIKMNTTLYW